MKIFNSISSAIKIKAQEILIFQQLTSLRILKFILMYYKYALINEYTIKIFIDSLLSSVHDCIDKGKQAPFLPLEYIFYLRNVSDMLKNAYFTVNNEATN